MNLEQLANIVEVSKTHSLTDAALNRNITLPALSQSLTQLEKEFDIKLFNRARTGTLPTSEGQIIIDLAKDILERVEVLHENVQKINQDFKGTFKLATLPGYMSLIIEAITELTKSHPSIKSYLFEGNTAQLYEKVLNQEIDIALISYNENEALEKNEFVFEKITPCKVVIAVNKQSPLAEKKQVTPPDIIDYPIAVHEDKKIFSIFSSYEKEFGRANVILTTNNTDSIKNVLMTNSAITIGLDYTFKNDPFFTYQKDIVLIDLVSPYIVQHYIGFVRLKSVHYTEISKMIATLIKKNLIRIGNCDIGLNTRT